MPFFISKKMKEKEKEKNNINKRPYKMINVAFPPSRYGLILAIIIIIIFALVEIFKLF